MATIRKPFLHDNILGGVETTLPAHLLGPDKWRTQHNIRNTPELEQVAKKLNYGSAIGSDEIRWLGVLPGKTPGYGKVVFLSPTHLYDLNSNVLASGLVDDLQYRRWATSIYAGQLYFTNDLNPLKVSNGGVASSVSSTVSGRYLSFWYDHAVLGYPTVNGVSYESRVQLSELNDFTNWTPTPTNEADFYDFVEWQQLDFPFKGVTGMGRLGKLMIVYTPTAVIPLAYVGKPKVVQVLDEMIQTRAGNTFPWTVVVLNNVHFFYDAEDALFMAYTGQAPEPIGEPVRQFMKDNLNPDLSLAAKMYGYVDPDFREVWWPFVSKDSSGAFDKAVVFNYKYKKWYTASVENVHSFCKKAATTLTIAQLTGTIATLTTTYPGSLVGTLGLTGASTPRIFGSSAGQLLREEVPTDASNLLLTADDPILESADFHYGDIRTVKENDAMVINAWWLPVDDPTVTLTLQVAGRDYLAQNVLWSAYPPVGSWTPRMIDGELNYSVRYGRVLRYKFVGANLRGLKFSAFSDRVRVEMPEK